MFQATYTCLICLRVTLLVAKERRVVHVSPSLPVKLWFPSKYCGVRITSIVMRWRWRSTLASSAAFLFSGMEKRLANPSAFMASGDSFGWPIDRLWRLGSSGDRFYRTTIRTPSCTLPNAVAVLHKKVPDCKSQWQKVLAGAQLP